MKHKASGEGEFMEDGGIMELLEGRLRSMLESGESGSLPG